MPYYQPIVDIRSGQLRGAEVLVRWRKPDGTLVLPGSFIPLAESSGLILDMTRDLMRRVCVEAGRAIGRRPGMKISFNLAGQLFGDELIVNDVRKIFAGSPIKLSQVVLEVTERDPIENFTATRQIIAAFQGLGVRIAIDDVGTGHSGLSYMLKLGVDIIKIDKMFVDAIGTDRNSTTIVETLVDLAHNMRMDVVAEGVENFEQVIICASSASARRKATCSRRRCPARPSCNWSRRSIRCRPLRLRNWPSRRSAPPERCRYRMTEYEKGRPIGPPSLNATREEPRKRVGAIKRRPT